MTAAAADSFKGRRRRNVVTDLFIGLRIPLLTITLYWFYQGHRFDILEGCVEATPNTFLLILLDTAWSLVIGLVSACYAVLTLRGVLHRAKDLKQLQVLEPGLTTSRYYRLMALAAAELCFTTPFTIYVLIYNIRVVGLYPYKGLADLHYDFGRVDSVAAILWRQDAVTVSVVNFRIWTRIGCAVFFFLMFGFTAEARTQYKLALKWVARRAGVSLFEDTPIHGVDSDPWDDFRVNVFSANRAEFDGGWGHYKSASARWSRSARRGYRRIVLNAPHQRQTSLSCTPSPSRRQFTLGLNLCGHLCSHPYVRRESLSNLLPRCLRAHGMLDRSLRMLTCLWVSDSLDLL